jgi:DNA-binding PadR family transcriptional regulator
MTNFTNHITERLNKAKEERPKQMTLESQHKDMWRGMAAFLALSVLSESDKGMTGAQVAARLMRSQVYEKTNNIIRVCDDMADAGLLTAEWDADPRRAKTTKRRHQLTPLGWAFLSETEKIWITMSQKVFSVTKKKVFIQIKK